MDFFFPRQMPDKKLSTKNIHKQKFRHLKKKKKIEHFVLCIVVEIDFNQIIRHN